MKLFQIYAQKNIDDAVRELGSAPGGLSATEALRRLAEQGPNELPEAVHPWYAVLKRQAGSALTVLLLGAAAVAWLLGERIDAFTILSILLINTVLGFVQEFHAERSSRTLHHLLGGTSRVRRGGSVLVIPRREIVRGDVVILEPGATSPADLRVTSALHAEADESALTGESAPVGKQASPAGMVPRTPLEAEQIMFSGTLLVCGMLEGVVFATGPLSEFGRIAAFAVAVKRRSIFEEQVAEFSRFIVRIVGVTLAILFAFQLFLDGSGERVGELFLFSLALAISVVPEALPVVMTITFSRGALHLARRHVVVRRLTAIEDLGHIQILCTDKTGTITKNRMRVADVLAPDRDACLAAAGESVTLEGERREPGNPFDRAVWQQLAPAFQQALRVRVLLGAIPFDHLRRRSSVIVPAPAPRGARIITKGAPETILDRAVTEGGTPLTPERRAEILSAFHECGTRGFRVLGVAARSVSLDGPWSDTDEQQLEWLGLLAFEDPLKDDARQALELARKLNVQIKILTGDSPEVAGSVACEVGIVTSPDQVISGPELEALGAAEFVHAALAYQVFARVSPEQKYRIVDALERTASVGFLGEGINDAPALKRANVALAVDSAVDLSKDVADVVLLDRSLMVIIEGIREGRAIVANVGKYIRYTLAGNFGNFASIAAVSLFIPFLPMLPVQILLTNLLTDLPLIAVAADRVDAAELARPRRLAIRDLVFSAMILGLVSVVFDLALFIHYRVSEPAVLQTVWFVFSILAELGTILIIRTSLPVLSAVPPARALLALVAGASAAALALPITSWGQRVFHFSAFSINDFWVVLLLVVGVLLFTELVKLQLVRRFRTLDTCRSV